jgi:hypothetical protein
VKFPLAFCRIRPSAISCRYQGMQFDYLQLMHTANTSIPNAIGMHLMCDRPHIHFIHDLIERFGVKAVQLALSDEELLKLMDAIEQDQDK